MNYDNGIEMKVGDIVWWNEGSAIGCIQEVFEEGIDFGEGNTGVPAFGIGQVPFLKGRPTVVVYFETDILDEGICILSKQELEIFQNIFVIVSAKIYESLGINDFSYMILRKLVDGRPRIFCNVCLTIVIRGHPNTYEVAELEIEDLFVT